MKVLFVWPNKDSFGYKPIGLSLLSAMARRLDWETKLFDTTEIDFGYTDNTQAGEEAKIYKPVDLSKYNFQKKRISLELAFSKTLKEFNPDCLAISVLSDEFLIAAQITKIAKKDFPELPVIWGGKFPTLNPRAALEKYNVDFVCVGEGLEAFADFLEGLAGRKDPYKIPNIWAKRGDTTVINNLRPLKQGLDDLPYVDWEIFDKRHFYKPFDGKVYISGDHMLNWGCPYHCSYCMNDFYHTLYKNKYFLRRYSVNRIIKELKYLKEKYDIKFIKFHDEDFLMRPLENLEELSRAYKAEVNIAFVIETNPKSVTEEKVRLLKYMNCVSVSMGIETGDDNLRKDILKRVDAESDIIKAFLLFKKMGIRTSSFNMLGIPYETRTTYEKSIELNRKCMVQYPDINFFYPFEGTGLRRISKKVFLMQQMLKDLSISVIFQLSLLTI